LNLNQRLSLLVKKKIKKKCFGWYFLAHIEVNPLERHKEKIESIVNEIKKLRELESQARIKRDEEEKKNYWNLK